MLTQSPVPDSLAYLREPLGSRGRGGREEEGSKGKRKGEEIGEKRKGERRKGGKGRKRTGANFLDHDVGLLIKPCRTRQNAPF